MDRSATANSFGNPDPALVWRLQRLSIALELLKVNSQLPKTEAVEDAEKLMRANEDTPCFADEESHG